jgi:hypothetical protein
MFDIIQRMKTALPTRVVKLIDDAMRPACTTIREVAKRQSAGRATAEDLAAGYQAASGVLKFIDGFDSDWNREFPEVPSSTPEAVLKTYRRYQLRFWQTAPQFLQPR